MVNISDLVRTPIKRDPSVQPIARSAAQMHVASRQLRQATPRAELPTYRGATASRAELPTYRGATTTSIKRDPSVQPIARSAAQMHVASRQLRQATPRAELPTYRGAATSSFVTQLSQSSSIDRFPTGASQGMGGSMLPLPTGRSVISPVIGDRAGTVPSSTLSTQGAFGGESGGMGAAAPGSVAADLGLGGIGDSVSSFGSGIVDTAKEYIPLAIKVILVVIVFKIVLWLLRGRR